MLYKKLAKPILFRMDPEKAHHLTINGLHTAGKLMGLTSAMNQAYGSANHPELRSEVFGIQFPNPVGLAAGLDKNGEAVQGFSSMGFGFMEVGTITPKPQAGNDRPRLFRLPTDEGLINRMGFNNVGVEQMARNLREIKRRTIPVAVNIGKNKVTPNERAEEDYRECIRGLYEHGDFFVVNISSPNTPDLRNLQHGNELKSLLAAVTEEMAAQKAKIGASVSKPVLVKIAPDLKDDELDYMIETIVQSGVSGIVATNTTISRDGLTHPNQSETGGLSGRPLTEKSTEIIRKVYERTKGKMPIIGAGGIFTAEDAYAKILAGASLVEIYTALIYEGPDLPKRLNEGLLALLKRDGFTHISQAIGAAGK